MATSPAGVAGVFDRAADTYDDVGVPWFAPIAEHLVTELDVPAGARALDVGCGRGAVLRLLARAVGPDGDALGQDLAPRMVQRTARDLAHLPHVTVQVGDARDLGLPEASRDVVTASLVLFFLPDPAAALQGWARVLAPGGRLGVTTFGPQDPRWVAVDEVFTPWLPPQMLDARASGRRGPFASDEGVEQLFRAAGLQQVRTVHRQVRADFRDIDHVLAWTWSHGQRAMWEAVPEAEHEGVRQGIAELLRTEVGADGSLHLDQDVRITLARSPR